MKAGDATSIDPHSLVHRLGGTGIDNLRPKAAEYALLPLGISVLIGGTAAEAAEQMRRAFPRSLKWGRGGVLTVGTADIDSIRLAGFDVIADPTTRFPNHGRLIHPDDAAGFSDENLDRLARAFVDHEE